MRLSVLFLLAAGSLAAVESHPTGTRITPPTLREIAPLGIQRGGTTEITIVGYNLTNASKIYFSDTSIQAKILRIRELSDQDDVRLGGNGTPLTVDLGPLPVRNEISAEIDVPGPTAVGLVKFRVQTPLGMSPEGALSIEPFYGEAPDREPNDNLEQAFEMATPAVLVGVISKPGDSDYFKFTARANERLIFNSVGRSLGSLLQLGVRIYDSAGTMVHEYRENGDKRISAFAYTFPQAGSYSLEVFDYGASGGKRNFYRVLMGQEPVTLSAFPLGVQRGKTAEVAVSGFNLQAKATVKGEPSDGELDTLWLRPTGDAVGNKEPSFTRVKLAVGDEPEILASATGVQAVKLPVTVNGRLLTAHQDFRFHARKGQKVVIEVNAARLESPLDSQLEILDSAGTQVPMATVRAVSQTAVTLRDHDSNNSGVRLESSSGFAVGDYVLIGSEVMRVQSMPRGPDDDVQMFSFAGQRESYLLTSPEAHALDQPAFKAEIHPAGANFPPNGLPIVRLTYRNDDGGPGYGKDSKLQFVAPADGDYTARMSDVRGVHGEEYTYRVTFRDPRPDFRLAFSPRNLNVPPGGRVPLTVAALRLEDHDEPISVSVRDLPPGLHADPAVIAPGQRSTVLTVSADAGATLPEAVRLRLVDAKGREAMADEPLNVIALMPRADVDVEAANKELILKPGGRVTLEVSVSRNNGFAGRVPLEVRNLPPTVRVIDVGLNGVLVNEDETKRSFTLEALPGASPLEQPIYVSANVETRAGMQQNSYMSQPVTLRLAGPAATSTH